MSENHIKMPRSQRAKQFAPFDAVVGLRDALKEKERVTELPKIISDDLSEENDRALKALVVGDTVKVSYYLKANTRYMDICGIVDKISIKKKKLCVSGTEIYFDDIYEIEKS